MLVLLMQFSSNAVGRLPALFEHSLVLWVRSAFERVLGVDCVDLYPELRGEEILTLTRSLTKEEVRGCAENLGADYYIWGSLEFLPYGAKEIEEVYVELNFCSQKDPDLEEKRNFSFDGINTALPKGGEIDVAALGDLVGDIVAAAAEIFGWPLEESDLARVAEGMTFHPRALMYFVYARRLTSASDLKLNYYLKAVAADPFFTIAYLNAARLLITHEDYKGAMRVLLRGYKNLKGTGDEADMLNLIALCTLHLGDPHKAIELWMDVVALSPGRAEPYYNIGTAYHSMGDQERAERFYRQALDIDGTYPLTWFGLGRLLAQQGKFEEACRNLNTYNRLMPGDPWAYSIMGRCLLEMGKEEEAEFSLKKAIQLDSEGEAGMMARDDLNRIRRNR